MEPCPYYLLFAGVNGAGKSTLYNTGLWQHGSIDSTIPRVNPDEILVANGWDWHKESDQIKAGRLAVKSIKEHLDRQESFNQETTLTGRSIIHHIRKAHATGFRIIMFYVCVKDATIANDRIAHRGTIGGHSINPDIVAKRYEASLANLVAVISLCDELYLYDNSVNLELEVRFERGNLAFFNPSEPHLAWISRIMQAHGYTEIDF